MDIQKLRQEFEKLPDIKGILYGSEFGFNESLNEYYHPDHTNHRLNYAFIMGAWMAWKAQAVPEGFVLVPEDQAKDTERLNFLLGGNHNIRTVVPCDIENEDYQKTGEHFLFTEVYWIDGWDYHENTSSQNERGAIDKAMIEAQEPAK